MPAAERAEPAAGHRVSPGTAAAPGSAAVPLPRALFSRKGMRWQRGAAAGARKMPGKTLKTTVLLREAGCVPGSPHGWVQRRGVARLAHVLRSSGLAGPDPSPRRAGWHGRPSPRNASWAGSGAAGVRLGGRGGQHGAGERTAGRENTAEPGRGSGLPQGNANCANLN